MARAREYIAAGDCYQVVISRRLSADYQGDPFELYRALRRVYPTPYLFFLRFGERALAGASPELLVRLAGRDGDRPAHRRHPAGAGRRPRRTPRSRPSCGPTRRRTPST